MILMCGDRSQGQNNLDGKDDRFCEMCCVAPKVKDDTVFSSADCVN